MNPFHVIRDFLVDLMPQAYDIIYVSGKVSRAFFFLLTVVLALAVRETWARTRRTDLKGEAFEMNQAFAFLAMCVALHAPYSIIPEISWRLCLAVSTAVLVVFAGLVGIRLFCAHSHRMMIGGDVNSGLRLGLYTLGAGIAAHAVVTAAFNG